MKNKKHATQIICFLLLLFAGSIIFILNMPLSMQLAVRQINGEVIYENQYHETRSFRILYDAENNCVTFMDIHTSELFGGQKIGAYSVFDLVNKSETKVKGFYDTVGYGNRKIYRYARERGWYDNLYAYGIYVAKIKNGVPYQNTLMFGVSTAEKPDCLFQEKFEDVFVFVELRTS